jgi:hypothetical protein
MELIVNAEHGMELDLDVEQGMELNLDVEQGIEGIDEMESYKSSPAAQGEEGGASSLSSSGGDA